MSIVEASESKLETAYRRIKERILDGGYGPGRRLVIDTLARELGMSQVPVREAIRRLEAEGWVVFQRNVGAQVTPVDVGAWESVMEALAVLEGHTTALAAGLLTAHDLGRLRDLNSAMADAVRRGDMLAFSRLNREFHQLIDERCPNRLLAAMTEDLWRRLDVIRRTVFVEIPARAAESVREHERLLALLERRAPAGEIERRARDNKLRTLRAYRRQQTAAGADAP